MSPYTRRDSAPSASIEQKLETARNQLLDLSLRNRLINFRPSTRRSLRILNDDLAQIYEELVLEERALTFKPATRTALTEPEEGVQSDEQTMEDSEPGDARRRYRASLQTDVDREVLHHRLFRIAHEASSVLEEQGYTVLYLALGFLEWKESESSETARKAPLILIPVELSRSKVRESYRLKWTREDIGTNLSLLERLAEFGVALPEFEMQDESDGVDEYLLAARGAIGTHPGWEVSRDAFLGFFSFTKFVMYRDLDPAGWPQGETPAEHRLIRELFAPQESGSAGELLDEQDIDDSINWKTVNHVMDADPSQIVAIESVKAGRNLVVEGPPGTGKSQTIANIIAELLADGKRVLFVSEKMAALEVVKERLDSVGLGDFCLELHSRKARRKEVLSELEHSLHSRGATPARDSNRLRRRLEAHIQELNEYASHVREPFGALCLSPFQLMEMRERAIADFKARGSEIPLCSVPGNAEWTRDLLDQSISAAEQLYDLRSLLSRDAVDAWSGSNPGQLLPSDIGEIQSLIEETRDKFDDVAAQMQTVSARLKLPQMTTLSKISTAREAFQLLVKAPEIDCDALLSGAWESMTGERLEQLLTQVEVVQAMRKRVLERFAEHALDTDVEGLLTSLSELGGLLGVLKKRYRQTVHGIQSLYLAPPSLFFKGYEIDLRELQATHSAVLALEGEIEALQGLFGHLWRGVDTELESLRQVGAWALSFAGGIASQSWTGELAELAGADMEKLQAISEEIEHLEDSGCEASELAAKCLTRLHVSEKPPWEGDPLMVPIATIIDVLENWLLHLSELRVWARYAEARQIAPLALLKKLVTLVEQCEIDREDIAPLLSYLVANNQLKRAFKKRAALADFVSKLHEKTIDRFRGLDEQIIRANRDRVIAKLHAQKPDLIAGVSPDSGMGILLHEINKKKRHMSIRRLMETAGDIIQQAKPCFMMSPLSIAQFLDPRITRFDVIVFDEASQVRPEDALGALLRGNQLVVMGDTKQLPPTSFFDRLVEDADDEEIAYSVGDVGSILHLCRESFPTKRLTWHYRSRHESLIVVSNHEFYDNSLVVYPSPMQSEKGLGLEFRHLPETVYDRGKSSENRAEARAVARAAITHYRERPNLSLGVGAFSTKQQNAIQEEIQRELEEHPEMERHFSADREEHFFVKNLETIQGDERDIIFLSIGYGRDAQGKLSKNFGPLNHDGGERRLNVLITRARHQCVVFSNFRADDLSIGGEAARGVCALKAFLKYAESGTLEYPQAHGRDTDSPFEDSVYEFLRAEGHDVHKQVGSAGYRIDLAVCDPASPGRYLLGIECDGAKYHSSRVARERDRLRQQVLENLGWTIHRVWSTEWFADSKLEKRRLLEAVEAAKLLPKKRLSCEHKRDASSEDSALAEKAQEPPAMMFEVLEPEAELPTTPYVECSQLSIRTDNDIPTTPRARLADAVFDVVKVEAPVHVAEVTRRIRALWGLKRTGSRIQEAVARGIRYASSEHRVVRRDNFLWLPEEQDVVPRCRTAREMLKIELICPEEITAAIHKTLEIQYASPTDAIPTTAARLLGFQQTSDQIRREIVRVLRQMLHNGVLVEEENDRIDLAERAGKTS